MSHSIIPPSSAGIWGKPGGCTGWVLMAQCYPETEETPEAAEGTASHWVASEVLESYQNDTGIKTCGMLVGQVAPNGIVITEEMAEGADVYVKDVLAVCQERGLLAGMRVEQRIEAPAIHELSYGTCDCSIYDPGAHELFIWDYKFGFEVVEAYENWQSLNYAEGIVDKFGFKGIQDQTLKITFRIAQPRAFHRDGPVREWKTEGGQLRGYTNILHANAHKALGADATTNTGDHCKHCPGRHACEAALTAGTRLYEAASKPVPVELTQAALRVQLSIVKRAMRQLKALESGYEAQVEGLIRRGDDVPGWITEPTFGRDKWDKSDEEVINMGAMFDKDLRSSKPITPKQAIKLGVDEAVIKAYSSQPRTGIKIVSDNGSKAKQVFSQ